MRHLVWSDSLQDRAGAILERERRRLVEVVDGQLVLTGGSSVPGVLTAGDIDLHFRVDPDRFTPAVSALSGLYRVAHLEIWSDSLATFGLPDEGIEIAVTPVGSTQDRRFVDAWRRIREDTNLRAAYNEMKESHSSADEATYLAAKRRFFDILAAAGGM